MSDDLKPDPSDPRVMAAVFRAQANRPAAQPQQSPLAGQVDRVASLVSSGVPLGPGNVGLAFSGGPRLTYGAKF